MSKAAIARINGAKSQGPVTFEGKAISAQNSLKHGITSSRVVLPGESQEEFDRLLAALEESMKPATEFEKELVHEMASSRWRMRRLEEMESALVQREMRRQAEQLDSDVDEHQLRMIAYAEVAESKAFRNIVRYQSQLRRAYEKAWKELDRLQAERAEAEQEQESKSPVLSLLGNPLALEAYLNGPVTTPHLPELNTPDTDPSVRFVNGD